MNMYEPGDIKVFNPNKEISKEITLEILIRHRDALKQARTGELPGVSMEQIRDNDRKINQARALNLIISAQREMITASRPIVFYTSTQKWKKKHKSEEDIRNNPFAKEDNDYNNLMKWLDFLRSCEQAIIQADKSKSLNDDFMITKVDGSSGEEKNELTDNFYEMIEDLESSYEQIYLLMLTNKIVSAGIEEDEEMEYKEKEAEAIRRIVEA
jgi:hypothetical protein